MDYYILRIHYSHIKDFAFLAHFRENCMDWLVLFTHFIQTIDSVLVGIFIDMLLPNLYGALPRKWIRFQRKNKVDLLLVASVHVKWAAIAMKLMSA